MYELSITAMICQIRTFKDAERVITGAVVQGARIKKSALTFGRQDSGDDLDGMCIMCESILAWFDPTGNFQNLSQTLGVAQLHFVGSSIISLSFKDRLSAIACFISVGREVPRASQATKQARIPDSHTRIVGAGSQSGQGSGNSSRACLPGLWWRTWAAAMESTSACGGI